MEIPFGRDPSSTGEHNHNCLSRKQGLSNNHSESSYNSQTKPRNQHCSINDIKDFLGNDKLLILNVNIRSVQKNFPKLHQLLIDTNLLPHIIALTETWTTADSFFIPSLPGYSYVTAPSESNRSGGVALFVNNKIDYSLKDDLKFVTPACENLWVEISYKNKKALVGVVYRHPTYNISDFQNKFEQCVFDLNRSNKPFFISGDFNIDLLQSSNNDYINSISSLGCKQYIASPTRITINSSTLIDHFYSNLPEHSLKTKILLHNISDHLPIVACANIFEKILFSSTSYKVRDLTNFNADNFILDLEHNLLKVDFISAEQSFNCFNSIFYEIVNKHAPMVVRSKKELKIKRKPWISNKITRLISTKNLYYRKFIVTKSPLVYNKYKKVLNNLTRLKEKAKRAYYNNKMKYASKSSKLTWQTINQIVNLQGKAKIEIKSIQTNDTVISDSKLISETLNQFFCSIGNASTISSTSQSSLSHIPRVKNSFFLKPITKFEVERYIKELDSSKSVRPNDPPIKFIKIASKVLSPIVTKLFNLFIKESCFPRNLKEACVIPIFKKGDKTACGNYRPISLTSPFSKLFERCLLDQLNSFFLKFNILNSCQYGFQRNISTEHALSDIYEKLVQSVDEGKVCCSIFLDISKAFDSVNHKLLLKKLSIYGIRGPALLLLKSFLENRCQYTMVNSYKSLSSPISSRVPQGSVLGPFLFILFINDLPLITKMKTTLFADDACLSFAHDSATFIESFVNLELEKVSKWMLENKLSLNVDKTNYILFQKKKLPISISLTYNGNDLIRKTDTKYLGVIIDEKLNFKSHVKYCIKKLNKCLWAVCRLRKFTNTNTLRMIYYSIAFPYLKYCITTWGGASKTILDPLFRKQKIIIRCILHQPYMSPSSPLFHSLNILKLEDLYKLQMGKLMHKHYKNKTTTSNHLTGLSSIHTHNTRSMLNNNYYLPSVRTNLGKTSLYFNGPKIWNSIPNKIRNSSDFVFKRSLKKYLIGKYV